MGAVNDNTLSDGDPLVLVMESYHQLEGLHDLLSDTLSQPRLSLDALQLCAMLRPTLAHLDLAAQQLEEMPLGT